MIRFTRSTPRRWVYWGTLHQPPSDSRTSRFWFRLEDPPYWVGNGWRFRVAGDTHLHVGRAVQVSTHEEALGGRVLMFTPREVGDWGVEKEAEEGIPGGVERTTPEHR